MSPSQPVNDNNPVFTSPSAANVAENTTAVRRSTRPMPTCRLRRSTYSISGGADAALFTIDGTGNLAFLAAPDYEVAGDFDGDNVYEVEVTADDNGGTPRRS